MPHPTPQLAQQPQARQTLMPTALLRQALRLLPMRNHEITHHALALAKSNRFVSVTLPEKPDETWKRAAYGSGHMAESYFADSEDALAGVAANALSLTQHIFQQIDLLFPPGDKRALAYSLVGYVTPAGWLDIEEARLDIPEAEYASVVARLQDMEPTGLFARNLAECLTLQLKDQGDYTPFMARIIAHLSLVLEGGAEAIAHAIDAPLDKVTNAMARLRRLNPKPGSQFANHQDQGDIYRPDIIVTEDATTGGFRVALNRTNTPEVRVTALDDSDTALSPADKILLAAARREVAAIHGRGRMLLVLAELACSKQSAFIRDGSAALRVLTMAEAASQLGYHPSSITRLVKDKLVSTPRGLVRFADFFSPAITSQSNTPIASKAVTAILLGMLETEDKTSPLSDAALASKLAQNHGVHLSRRAIAKRRSLVHIAPYHTRTTSPQP